MSARGMGDSTQAVVRDRRVPTVPEALWSPLAAGVLTPIPGVIGLAAGQPLLQLRLLPPGPN